MPYVSNKETWMYLTIKGLSAYQISNLGRIRKRNSKSSEYEVTTTYEANGYRVLELTDDTGYSQRYEVDKLVALSFLPLPSGAKKVLTVKDYNNFPYYIIHNNFISMDNRPENLTWRPNYDSQCFNKNTNSFNSNLRILLKDHFIFNERIFDHPQELADYLGMTQVGLYEIIKQHHRVPYKNRYTFELISANDITTNNLKRPSTEVLCKDYVSGEIKIYNSLLKASMATGINKDIIKIKINGNKHHGVNSLLAGYDFVAVDNIILNNPPNWPIFTREQAIKSRNNFFNVSIYRTINSKEVEVYDIYTGNVTKYIDLQTAVDITNENYFIVFDYVLGKKKAERFMKIFGNKIYRAVGDIRSWNDSVELNGEEFAPAQYAYDNSYLSISRIPEQYII